MAWQKCPVCNGTGKNYGGLQTSAICPTCNGQRIISEVTGLPPAFISYGTSSSSDTNVTTITGLLSNRTITHDDAINKLKTKITGLLSTTTNDDENKKPPTSGGFNY